MRKGELARATIAALCLAATGCSAEKRQVGPQPPLTPPWTSNDPRAPILETNVFEVSEGGRLFRWYACGNCHTDGAAGAANLARTDGPPRTLVQLYGAIADGPAHAYDDKIGAQQIWRLAAYVKSLPSTPDHKRRRASADQQGEPQGEAWTGPLR